jgi:hypothetical protein
MAQQRASDLVDLGYSFDRADGDVVVAALVHGDLAGPEVVVPAQADDLAHDLGVGRVRAVQRPRRPVAEAVLAQLLEAVQPLGAATCRTSAG